MKRPDRRRPTGYTLPQSDAVVRPEFPLRVDRDVYPRPDCRFSHAGSETAPAGAPNVLVVLLGDVGYGVMSTFGGLVASPTLDRLAKGGLRYCRFHTTGASSPTRAVVLTGRHHGSIIRRSCATVAEILRQNGYATGWWGACPHVPEHETSAAGPFGHWPTSLGFDHFYGYLGGACDQFQPSLYRNTTPVDVPLTDSAYHLTTDLTDDCIAWMRRQTVIAPERPLFAYFAPPGGRAPHQPPPAWRGRHAEKFDFGWEEYRKRVFERQRELGVVPRESRLTERPGDIPAWTDAPSNGRRLACRFFENYADCVEHTDAEVGRIIDALDELSALENTLVLYVVGDCGGNDPRTGSGTLSVGAARDGCVESPESQLARIDEIGRPGTYPHMPAGWTWAGSAPFSLATPSAPHFGATRAPLVIHWPRRILAAGGLRFQFHHVVDVVPTILDVVGIAHPSVVNGVVQRPIAGVSTAYSFAAERAAVASTRRSQHFESFPGRAQYADGWLAFARDARSDRWELYHVADDFSQSTDVADREPGKLRELQDQFVAEAARYNAPVEARHSSRIRMTLFPGMWRLPEAACPSTHNTSHVIGASVCIPRTGAEGVIVCCGGGAAGWSLYIMNRRLVYHYNFHNIERTEAISNRELPVGDIEVRVVFANATPSPGGPADVAMFIDGEPVGGVRIPRQVRAGFGAEGIDVGIDKCSPVSRAYRDHSGFPFTGTIARVTLELDGVRGGADASLPSSRARPVSYG